MIVLNINGKSQALDVTPDTPPLRFASRRWN
jgi:hypothetical protein